VTGVRMGSEEGVANPKLPMAFIIKSKAGQKTNRNNQKKGTMLARGQGLGGQSDTVDL